MASKSFTWGNVSWEGDIDVSEAAVPQTTTLGDSEKFHVIRVVANLKLSKKVTGALNPPARLNVKVTQADIQKAGSIDKIKVAYWKGDWVVLTDVSKDAGSVTVNYDKNGDPPIAVGH